MEVPQHSEAFHEDRFENYDSYLDSFVTEEDVFYLRDRAEARRVVELGHLHAEGEPLLQRETFEGRKAALAAAREAAQAARPRPLLGAGRHLAAHTLLCAVAEREQPLRRGSLLTVMFVRGRTPKGQEVSGYIDLAHRLEVDEAGLAAAFALQRRLLPQPGDLSCYNWSTGTLTSSPSPNFEVVADSVHGLAFKCRRDRKLLVVHPGAESPGDYTTRTEVAGAHADCLQAVIFDHMIGRCT